MLATTMFFFDQKSLGSTRLELGIFFLQDLPAVGGKKGPNMSGTIWLVVNGG